MLVSARSRAQTSQLNSTALVHCIVFHHFSWQSMPPKAQRLNPSVYWPRQEPHSWPQWKSKGRAIIPHSSHTSLGWQKSVLGTLKFVLKNLTFINPTSPVLGTVLGVTEESKVQNRLESSWGNGASILGTMSISK